MRISLTRRWFLITLGVLALIACVRIGNTWRKFSETLDEPIHLAAGYEYWTGPYTIDLQHPPLARALGALPLIAMGVPAPSGDPNVIAQGNELLYWNDRYEKTLARVRAPNLLLFLIAVGATAAWARRHFDRATALVATLFFTSLPPVLAHAGFVTTDMALLAAVPLSLLALDLFLEKHSPRRALFLGAAIGFGILAKMSFVVFFPPAAAVMIALARPWRRDSAAPRSATRAILIILAAAFLVTWGGYKFDFRRAVDIWPNAADYVTLVAPEAIAPSARWLVENVSLPAPSLLLGFLHLAAHNDEGHGAYLFGSYSVDGWWYYFPVVFFYKTPIPFLLLMAFGVWLIVRARSRTLLPFVVVPLVVMLVAMAASINIGVRHILPIYAPLSIVAAHAAVSLWRSAFSPLPQAATAALAGWLVIGSALAHPDYLSWFNVAAGDDPSYIAIDSNLDWGQDALRLERVVREMRLQEIHMDYWTNARLDSHGIRALPLDPHRKTSGWVAVGETPFLLKQARYGSYAWLNAHRPVRRIGDTIRLYYIP